MQGSALKPVGDAAASHTGATAQGTSSLRPRTKRNITGLEDFASEDILTGVSPYASPFHSRAPSPIPSKHPSRSSSTQPGRNDRSRGSPPSRQPTDRLAPDHGSDLATSLSGLWGKSWTSLQGLASNVLGSDASTDVVKDKLVGSRQRRPLEYTHSQTPKQWGPSRQDSQLGIGSQEERQAKLRAKKRQDLLASKGASVIPDSKYKRRTSDDFDASSSLPYENGEQDILVYIYYIVSTDTLPGIAIKFNCSIEILKKANRLWSNTGIQAKKYLFVPVDSCGTKGKKVDPAAEDAESLSDSPAVSLATPSSAEAGSSLQRPNTSQGHPAVSWTKTSLTYSAPSSPPFKSPEDKPWKHDSWVALDGLPTKTEIGRVPRHELGFFPRARRKSLSYSDLDTPTASLDLPRPSVTPSESSSASIVHEHRKRRSSSANQWAHQMVGPGGVGKLSGRGISTPGPSEDQFNKALRKHLPSLAPKIGPAGEGDGEATPSLMTLENVGGAIEGWMRKFAAKTASTASKVGQPLGSGQFRGMNGVNGSMGDLIELSNSFEIGEDEVDPEDLATADDQQTRGRSGLGPSDARQRRPHAAAAAEQDPAGAKND